MGACTQQQDAVSKVTGELVNVNDSLATDQTIEAYITPFRENLNKQMDSVLAYAPKTMHKKDGELETTIGNLMADIVVSEANPIYKQRTGKEIDLCLLNHGGIRAAIGEGNVITRTAFEVMPFENSIVVAELSAEKVHELIGYLARNQRAHPISGLTLAIDQDGNVKRALINGKPIDDGRTYSVVTSDYLQNGGDRMVFLKDPKELHVLDYKIRNAMLDYFKKVDTLPAKLDQRFVRVEN